MIHPIITIDDEIGGAVYIQRRADEIGDEIRLSLCRGNAEYLSPKQALKLAEALTEMAHAIQKDQMTPEDIAAETRERR